MTTATDSATNIENLWSRNGWEYDIPVAEVAAALRLPGMVTNAYLVWGATGWTVRFLVK